jgi:hypothetical protein
LAPRPERCGQNAASQSGLDPALLKKMLPMLAMLVAADMAKQGDARAAAQPSPAGGGLLGSLLGGQGVGTGSARPDAAAPGLAAMLDLNGDGNPLDDILRMVGKAKR